MATIVNQRAGAKIENIGGIIIRYGLVLILLWIGGMKFTAYEAKGLEGIVSTSPLLSWGYRAFSLQGFSNLLGVFEITFAVLIAARPFAPLASALGSFGAIGMFLVTLSFFFTAAGVWAKDYGFPVLGGTGQFLVKDVLLLGAAIWTAGEALRAAYESRRATTDAG